MTVQTTFIDSTQQARLVFMKHCVEATDIWIACAWARQSCPCAEALWNAHSKIRALVVGLTFPTEPAFLQQYEQHKNVRVVRGAGGAIFHPKVYLFKKGRRFQCLLGSSNFTGSGFGANFEANIAVDGTIGEPIFRSIRDYVSSLLAAGDPIGPVLEDYEAQYRRAKLNEVPQYLPSKAVVRALAQKKAETTETNSIQLEAKLRRLPKGEALARIAKTLVDAVGRRPALNIQWNSNGFTVTTSLPGFLVRLAILEVHKTYALIQVVHGLAQNALEAGTGDKEPAKKFYEDADVRIQNLLPQAKASRGRSLWGLRLVALEGDEGKLVELLTALAQATVH